jgi:hypothetical protein
MRICAAVIKRHLPVDKQHYFGYDSAIDNSIIRRRATVASRREPVRKRGRKVRVRTPEQERLVEIADGMEVPLARAANLVEALYYVGFGMHSHGEDGTDAVLGIATSMRETIETVQTAWKKMIRAI